MNSFFFISSKRTYIWIQWIFPNLFVDYKIVPFLHLVSSLVISRRITQLTSTHWILDDMFHCQIARWIGRWYCYIDLDSFEKLHFFSHISVSFVKVVDAMTSLQIIPRFVVANWFIFAQIEDFINNFCFL